MAGKGDSIVWMLLIILVVVIALLLVRYGVFRPSPRALKLGGAVAGVAAIVGGTKSAASESFKAKSKTWFTGGSAAKKFRWQPMTPESVDYMMEASEQLIAVSAHPFKISNVVFPPLSMLPVPPVDDEPSHYYDYFKDCERQIKMQQSYVKKYAVMATETHQLVQKLEVELTNGKPVTDQVAMLKNQTKVYENRANDKIGYGNLAVATAYADSAKMIVSNIGTIVAAASTGDVVQVSGGKALLSQEAAKFTAAASGLESKPFLIGEMKAATPGGELAFTSDGTPSAVGLINLCTTAVARSWLKTQMSRR